jgi:nitrite reductase (NADH) small subunit
MTEVALGKVDDIPVGEGRAYAVEGLQIAVFRLRDGSLRAIDAVCPHRGGPLADGLTDARVVVCPLHGFTYDLATGKEVGNGGVAVTAYPVRADDAGTIHLSMDGVPARRQECDKHHEKCPRNTLGASRRNARETVILARHEKWAVDVVSCRDHREVRQGVCEGLEGGQGARSGSGGGGHRLVA